MNKTLKSLIAFSSLLFLNQLTAQMVHLDCTGVIDEILGENVYGKSSDSIGDEKGPYEFDIDLEKETAKIGGWTSTTLTANSNNPAYLLSIGDPAIIFGKNPAFGGDWEFRINRETLSFGATIGYGAVEYIKGSCVLIEERVKPNRKF